MMYDKLLVKLVCMVCGLGSRNLYGIMFIWFCNFFSFMVFIFEYLFIRKCLLRDVIWVDMGIEESWWIFRVFIVVGLDFGVGVGI